MINYRNTTKHGEAQQEYPVFWVEICKESFICTLAAGKKEEDAS